MLHPKRPSASPTHATTDIFVGRRALPGLGRRTCLMLFFAGCLSGSAFAASFNCNTGASGPSCLYTGPVKQAYVNKWGSILLYWDASIAEVEAEAATVGLDVDVTQFAAGIVNRNTDPDFADALYSTILAANLSGATVSVMMRTSWAGYLEIDRIWIKLP